MTRIVKCGLIQASAALDGAEPPEHHRQAMLEKHIPMIEEASRRGVQILCLQEMFTGPYFAAEQDNRWIEMAESIPDGPTVAHMQELAERHGMVLVVPIPEHEMSGFIYNTAAVIDADGAYLGKYRKNHIPHTYPGF